MRAPRFTGPWTRQVTVQVKGGRLEEFINGCMRRGIGLRQIERPAGHMLVARLDARDFRRLRALEGRRAWQIRTVERHGGGFLIARLLRRPAFLAGALFAALAWYTLSSFVWFVAVEGVERVPAAAVLEAARQAGVAPGVPAASLDAQDVQRHLLLSLDDLVWAALELRGTRAVIRVAERRLPDMVAHGPGHIVAQTDGVIERVSVLNGFAVVEPGETVRAGQLLISGQLAPGSEEFQAKTARGEMPYVRAAGSVFAHVWHESTAEVVVGDAGVEGATAAALAVARALTEEWLSARRAEAVGEPAVQVEELADGGVVRVTVLVQAVADIGEFRPVTW